MFFFSHFIDFIGFLDIKITIVSPFQMLICIIKIMLIFFAIKDIIVRFRLSLVSSPLSSPPLLSLFLLGSSFAL